MDTRKGTETDDLTIQNGGFSKRWFSATNEILFPVHNLEIIVGWDTGGYITNNNQLYPIWV